MKKANGHGRQVQPRVCGERAGRFNLDMPINGSAPRVRGTHFVRNVTVVADRFSPACAGNA